jgi:hypothetical protein
MEIRLKIERLEGGRAFLRDEKGRLIVWPRDFLPNDAIEGEGICFDSVKNSQKTLPKDILNEIFLLNENG